MTLGTSSAIRIDRSRGRQRRTMPCASAGGLDTSPGNRPARMPSTREAVTSSPDELFRREAPNLRQGPSDPQLKHGFVGRTSPWHHDPIWLGRRAGRAARVLTHLLPRIAFVLAGTCSIAVLSSQVRVLEVPRFPPSSKVEESVSCADRGRLIPNCIVTLSSVARTRSNAHLHVGGGQPTIRFGLSESGPFASILTVNTGSSGQKAVWFETHAIGQYEFVYTCRTRIRRCTYRTVLVGYDDLRHVPENHLWFHIGGTASHGGNYNSHWMTPHARRKFTQAVNYFNNENSNRDRIAVNDMSLPRGGTFDIYRNWRPPHPSHSRGTAVDIRANGAPGSIPVVLAEAFAAACKEYGAKYAAVEGSGVQRHVHCHW